MPSDYLSVRNSCYAKKRKNGVLSASQEKECKKIAAIWFFKKHGKSVQEVDASMASEDLPDDVDLAILEEQIEFFGSLEEYEKWSNGEGFDDEKQ